MTNRLSSLCLLLILLFSLATPSISAQAQAGDAVGSLIASLTAEQKVGQLFLVSFTGTDVSPESQIYDLIVNRYVGGVVLTSANDNFVASPDTAAGAASLTNTLQQTHWDEARNPESPTRRHPYIPLFIGISQEGGGYPNDQILSGLTPIPSQMALGAAWDRALAEQSGQVVGRELSALGFNFYLGLSLDVLNAPNPAINTGLGARVFGGNPYWVGEMGQAFVSGLRAGSLNRMAVVAKHFPGRGGSDRLPDQEVPTVRRSLEELRQIDLAPFFAVSGAAPSTETTVDGMLISHIRYQGFQGNVRPATKPINFDQQALGQILALPEIQPWWRSGGLVVSDDLGLDAVRRFYDPDNTAFSARLVTREAFLAGNDLLYMGNITSIETPNNYDTIVSVLDSFAQKYREDAAFATRVDESLRRILTVKYRLYPSFVISAVLPGVFQKDTLGQSTDHVFAIARQAATLISPSQSDFSSILPSPPKESDYIVFITDEGSSRQCSTCLDVPLMPVDAFESAVVRLYGPSAAALVSADHLSSYSFSDVNLLLQDEASEPDLLNDLERANIVVISALDLPVGQPQTQTLRRFLTEKQSVISSKNVLMFSFGAPYYLDATDISKLDAYYGMYGQSAPFVQVAARLLFQELPLLGSSPVSIPGTGYNLDIATSPDPNQQISLNHDLPVTLLTPTPEASATSGLEITPTPEASLTPTITPVPLFKLGDTIAVRTGVILDRNKHPVPDGTVVRFLLFQGESGLTRQSEAITTDGVAVTSFSLDQPGSIRIQVESGLAKISNTIRLDVNNEGASPTIITPTPVASSVPTEIPPTPAPTPNPGTPGTTPEGYPTFLGWFLALLLMAAGVALAYWLGLQFAEIRWAVRWALLALLGGLAAYNYLVLEMPGSTFWLDNRGLPAFLQAILLGQIIGFLAGWVWRLMAERRNQTQE